MAKQEKYQLYGYLECVPTNTGFVTLVFKNQNDYFVQLSFDNINIHAFEKMPTKYQEAIKPCVFKINADKSIGRKCIFGFKWKDEVYIKTKTSLAHFLESEVRDDSVNPNMYSIVMAFIKEHGADRFRQDILRYRKNVLEIFSNRFFKYATIGVLKMQFKRKQHYFDILWREVKLINSPKYNLHKLREEILWSTFTNDSVKQHNLDTEIILKNSKELIQLRRLNNRVSDILDKQHKVDFDFLSFYIARYIQFAYISLGTLITFWSTTGRHSKTKLDITENSDENFMKLLDDFESIWKIAYTFNSDIYSQLDEVEKSQSDDGIIDIPAQPVVVYDNSQNKTLSNQQEREERYLNRGISDAKKGFYNPPWQDQLDEDKLVDNKNYEKGWEEGRAEVE